MASHDEVTLETTERRKRARGSFVAQVRTAILAGLETPAGVLAARVRAQVSQSRPQLAH